MGKTTFAINFALALSRHGRTVLVDLDTGTSAIRNAIDVPIGKDLYHFFRKNEPLGQLRHAARRPARSRRALAELRLHRRAAASHRRDHELRRRAQGPADRGHQHAARRLRHPGHARRPRRERHRLPAVLELRHPDLHAAPAERHAGRVRHRQGDPLPQAAPDLQPRVAVLRDGRATARLLVQADQRADRSRSRTSTTRRCRTSTRSRSIWPRTSAITPSRARCRHTIDEFRVHYVLNLFNGVEDSFNTAVKPFLDNLTSNVSARCGVTNLGWITRSDAIHRANCNRIPALLLPESRKKAPRGDRVRAGARGPAGHGHRPRAAEEEADAAADRR